MSNIEKEVTLLFMTNMNVSSIADYIVSQQKAIDGLSDNNRELRKEFRKVYSDLLKLKDN